MGVPYYRFYPADFEADTSHLTLAEDGAYNRLLRLCWLTPGCSLPDDEAWIFRRCRAHTEDDKQAVLTVLNEFFRRENQRVFNPRLNTEFEHVQTRRQTCSKNGQKGGRPKGALKTKEKERSDGLKKEKLKKANQNQNQNHIKKGTNVPKKEQEQFDHFWDLVPRKEAKGRARKAFLSALKKTSFEYLCDGMSRYALDRRGKSKQYTALPASWLNDERWSDERTSTAAETARAAADLATRGMDCGPDYDPSQPLPLVRGTEPRSEADGFSRLGQGVIPLYAKSN